MNKSIEKLQNDLCSHSLYKNITDLNSLRTFMSWHVFAVWDFMSLLKSLQKQITCVSIPWFESKFDPELVRLINEIVIAEESDIDFEGNVSSHFSLYLKAMDEVGADTFLINKFLETQDFSILPQEIQEMLTFHLNLAMNGKVHEVASSFFFGREKLIPEMFTSLVKIVEDKNLKCPTLLYYFKRHIEIDGDSHGPLALKCLDKLLVNEEHKDQALIVAINSLNQRNKLWSFIQEEIYRSENKAPSINNH